MAPLRLTVGSGCRRKEGQRFTTIPIRGDIVSFSHGRLRYGLANELLIPSTGVALVGPNRWVHDSHRRIRRGKITKANRAQDKKIIEDGSGRLTARTSDVTPSPNPPKACLGLKNSETVRGPACVR